MGKSKKRSRIEREKRVVSQMIRLYSQHKMGQKELSAEMLHLEQYAHKRLDCCKFGEAKKPCKNCPVHCYAPQMREQVREVMRWAGPRMMFYSPLAVIRHWLGI